MKNFTYYTPTKVVFGKDTELETGKLVKEQGAKKVLVHYGGGSVERSGLLERVYRSLEKEGIEYTSLGGVVPNPRLSLVQEGIQLCREQGVDFILAVGGGSVIDSAKAIGYGVLYEGDVWDFFTGKAEASVFVPVATVLTIAAAGSEMSSSCVITNEEGWVKAAYGNDLSRCKFSVMNPELTYTLPDYQTQCGVVDILMHTMERYFTLEPGTELTDSLAEGLMRTVIHHGKLLKRDPKNYNSRAQIMWAGSLAHNDLTGCGTVGDYATHMIEHELSGMFDVAHGAGLSSVWGSWARYVYKDRPERFAQFAIQVLGVPGDYFDLEKTALEGIYEMENFYRLIDMPVSLKELGVEPTDAQIEEMAKKACHNGKKDLGNFKILKTNDVIEIYNMARK